VGEGRKAAAEKDSVWGGGYNGRGGGDNKMPTEGTHWRTKQEPREKQLQMKHKEGTPHSPKRVFQNQSQKETKCARVKTVIKRGGFQEERLEGPRRRRILRKRKNGAHTGDWGGNLWFGFGEEGGGGEAEGGGGVK